MTGCPSNSSHLIAPQIYKAPFLSKSPASASVLVQRAACVLLASSNIKNILALCCGTTVLKKLFKPCWGFGSCSFFCEGAALMHNAFEGSDAFSFSNSLEAAARGCIKLTYVCGHFPQVDESMTIHICKELKTESRRLLYDDRSIIDLIMTYTTTKTYTTTNTTTCTTCWSLENVSFLVAQRRRPKPNYCLHQKPFGFGYLSKVEFYETTRFLIKQ